jgi:hypothetical protein
VLFLGGFGLLTGAPTPEEARTEAASFLTERRGEVFAATIVLGAGACLFLFYLAGLRRLLGGADADPAALAAVLAAALATTLVQVGMAILAGAVVHPLEQDTALVVFDVFNALVTMGGFGFGFSLVAAAIAAKRVSALPGTLATAGIAIGLAQLATIPGLFVVDGVFAPLGPVALAAFWALTLWYVAVAVRMVRR